ncbi:hypothetical protein [Actinomycetospora termitidis]|uniref:Uncharacterized protein n=1 Tax=Actinomycetospora termitidis TaxID=3053470 RepID=A0ABT7M4B4_9PSEU|nr:hypothetical protein [Actinomycetospora sp. Odt1-22]MDL5154592.1 hypothetical protein [Actinomycetospora sp. Odt1-22]
MTDEPDEPSRGGTSDASGPTGPQRPDRVAGEAAAIARFGDGPALFSPDVPAPRHPHVGPLLPHRRRAERAVGHTTTPTPADPPSGELVLAPRYLPAHPADDLAALWRRVGRAARRGVEVAVEWTARGVLTAVSAAGAAAEAVLTLVFGPERPALPEGRRRQQAG